MVDYVTGMTGKYVRLATGQWVDNIDISKINGFSIFYRDDHSYPIAKEIYENTIKRNKLNFSAYFFLCVLYFHLLWNTNLICKNWRISMKESLTNRQIAFMLFGAIVGYGVVNLPNDAAAEAGTGAWIPLVFTTASVMLFTYFIIYIGYNNENQTLFEYSQKLLGKALGKFITIIYIIYFLLVLSILIRSYSEVITTIFFQKTPVWAISLFFLLVVGYALTKNLGTIARITEIYIPLVIMGYALIHILMATQGKMVNIRPIFGSENMMTYAKASFKLLLPFFGSEIIMFIPISKKENKGVIKYPILSILFIGLIIIFIVVSTISVVGVEDIVYYNASVFKVLKGIDIPYLEIFRRPDGIYIMFWTLNIFCSLCIWSYGSVSLSKKFFKKIPLSIIILSVIAISFMLSQFPKSPDELKKMFSLVSYMGVFTLIVMPIILFIMTKVRKK